MARGLARDGEQAHNQAMRFVLLFLAVLAAAPAANADQTDPRLAGLFDQLRAAQKVELAAGISNQIWSIWIESDDKAAGE